MESVMQSEKKCYLCGRNGNGDPLESHHVFGGANRKHSESYGLKVWLCGDRCHRNGPQSVHRNIAVNRKVQSEAQKLFELMYGTRDDFRHVFGRSYIEL